MDIIVTEAELNALSTAILRRYGIDFTCYEPQSLKRRVIHAIKVFHLNSIHELWIKLLKEKDFVQPFIDVITVGLTAMFRDPVLWKSLKQTLLQDLSSKEQIGIWHAGCSSGEEVYTMGIVLKELKLNHRVKALATDINTGALREAKTGHYPELKLIEYDKNYHHYNPFKELNEYYISDGTVGRMDPELIRHVEFRFHNLITEEIEEKFDIIFCRNVMIYFDETTKLRLIEQFHTSLNEGGYLVIGFYDSLMSMAYKERFDFIDKKAKLFRKIG